MSMVVRAHVECDDFGAFGTQQLHDPRADTAIGPGHEYTIAHQYVALPPEMS